MQTHFPSGDVSDLGTGLLLAPFRGVRYDLSRVGGLANVTSPPYDVIGPGTLERLLAASPYNVVRLILPASVLGGDAAGGAAAGGGTASGVTAEHGRRQDKPDNVVGRRGEQPLEGPGADHVVRW